MARIGCLFKQQHAANAGNGGQGFLVGLRDGATSFPLGRHFAAVGGEFYYRNDIGLRDRYRPRA